MASSSYRNITDDLEYYTKAYESFASRCVYSYTRGSHETDWQDSFLVSDSVLSVEKVLASLEVEEPLRILGVGSGNGEAESRLICQLLKKHPTIHSTVIEPARDPIQHYQTLVSKDALGGVTWDWHQQTWQEYWECRKSSSKPAPRFHFIIATHVLYYVGDLEQSILDLTSCLEEGGSLAFLIVAGENPLVSAGVLVDGNPFAEFNAANAAKLLQKHQIRFSEIDVPAKVEVTGCFENEDEHADHLIDFFSQVIHFRRTAPPDVVKRFMASLRDSSIERDGRLFINDACRLIIATK